MPSTALLFDAEGHDSPFDLAGGLPTPAAHQLLWVDIQAGPDESLPELLGRLPLDDSTRAWLLDGNEHPVLHRFDQAVQLRVNALEKGQHHYRAAPVRIVAGQNVVFTAHEGEITFLDAFRGLLEADTQLGQLDSAAFLAVVLTHHVEGYYHQLSPIEDNVDRLDEHILAEPGEGRRHLETLVGLRRRVSELRRLLAAHRLVYVALASPDFGVYENDQPEVRLTRLLHQFERTQEAVGHTRETVLGSFDLLMSSTGQRTNEVMRVLTVVTVTLGIVAAVAGIMGMNFQADIFKAGNSGFEGVLLFSAAVIVAVIAVGRRFRWL
jgi:Mg2+ and Co2+ transporter CorA